MKKILIRCLIITIAASACIVSLFHYFSYPERTKRATIVIGESQKFSKSEVEAAEKCVYDYILSINDMYLKKLWYDEEISNGVARGYTTSGKGSINGVDEANVIVLYTNHHTGLSNVTGPNTDYNNYNWILIRDNKTADWRIDDSGYC